MRAIHPRAALLVYLTVPEAQRHATALQLMQMFGLTQAEARLAHALVQGSTVDEYAEAQGLAMPTVRSQVRAVLDKTRTARQQDLVRLLSAIPSARAPRPVAMPALRSG
jgi:DNA-binding CsgD family transcriptional regulator